MPNILLTDKTVGQILQAIDDEIRLIGVYAEIAQSIEDSGVRNLFLSIAGDEYGHARALALFAAQFLRQSQGKKLNQAAKEHLEHYLHIDQSQKQEECEE